MQDWHSYVTWFYSLPPDRQQLEWNRLSPTDREAFVAARAVAAHTPASPSPAAPTKSISLSRLVLGCGCLGLIVVVLLFAIPLMDTARDAGRAQRAAQLVRPTPSPVVPQGGPQTSFTVTQICRAGIAALMGRDPSTISARQVGDLALLSYVRPDDGTRWSYRCRLEGRRIVWASDTGRWRTHPLDEVLIFEETASDTLRVEQRFTDGSSSDDSFSKAQLGS